MDDGITEISFLNVQRAVERVCKRAQEDLKLVVTEGDLQSWIFADLVGHTDRLDDHLHVHTQINYLKGPRRLGNVPDIVLLPSGAYNVDSNGALHNQKGYTVLGSSIALEIKLLRSHRRDGFVLSVKKDLHKLRSIRDRHYAHDQNHRFFAASVVLCRQNLPEGVVIQLRTAAAEAGIQLWLFNRTKD